MGKLTDKDIERARQSRRDFMRRQLPIKYAETTAELTVRDEVLGGEEGVSLVYPEYPKCELSVRDEIVGKDGDGSVVTPW